jgi:hypothetical protein
MWCREELDMDRFRLTGSTALIIVGALTLTACASATTMTSSLAPQPASIRPDEIVGRWGYGAYYSERERARTQAAASAECSRAVTISRGPTGGLIMPMVNQSQQELSIKGGPGGRNFIGPPGDAGAEHDSDIVSFDGNILITRTVAADEAGHVTSIYMRCRRKA